PRVLCSHTAPTRTATLSLHDALPILAMQELTIKRREATGKQAAKRLRREGEVPAILYGGAKPETITVDPKAILRMIHGREGTTQDRKSTRLNSSHVEISYAVFCLKKK